MKTHLFVIALLFVILLSLSMTWAADSLGLPGDFPQLVIHQYGQTAPGVLIGWFGFNNPDYYVVLDQTGYPLFYSKTEQMSYPGVMFNGLITAPAQNGYTLKDETFTVVDSFKTIGDYSVDTHDFKLMPNGHALILVSHSMPVDMSQIVSGGRPDALVTDDVIQEIDANKNIVFEWHSIDHIPIIDSFFNLMAANIDYAHFNSVNIDPFDNNLLISFRTTSEIVKVNRATGDVMWHLGGKENEFTFIGEHEENAPYYFVGQHSIWRLTNGDILFFDNGNIKGGGITESDRTYSRAVEYKIDEVNKTAQLVWEFRHTPDISTPSTGRVQKLSNGNVLIEWGSAIQNTASVPIVTEVSPTSGLVYEMYFSTYNKGAHMQKYLWTSSDLVKSQTFQNIEAGHTYNSATTGVSVIVNSVVSKENNGLAVKKHADAVRFPQFSGSAPQVLMDRVTISTFGIDYVIMDLNINIQEINFKDPNNMTVYYRPYEGQGVFAPLPTYHDANAVKLVVLDAGPGEFIFTYPDVQQIASAPTLKGPEDSGSISYAEPVTFEWAPAGLFGSFHLQVAKDAEFINIVIDDPNLTEFKYTMDAIEPDTNYFWRVNMTNDGGTSDWASASFTAVAPKVEVISPNGGEEWHKGLTYYIQWNYNMNDNVVIELYNGSTFIKSIATVSGVHAYEWEVDLSLRPNTNFYIKIKRAADATVYDMSDAPFSILQ